MMCKKKEKDKEEAKRNRTLVLEKIKNLDENLLYEIGSVNSSCLSLRSTTNDDAPDDLSDKEEGKNDGKIEATMTTRTEESDRPTNIFKRSIMTPIAIE